MNNGVVNVTVLNEIIDKIGDKGVKLVPFVEKWLFSKHLSFFIIITEMHIAIFSNLYQLSLIALTIWVTLNGVTLPDITALYMSLGS